MMVEFGKKTYPKKKEIESSDTTVRGAHWSIELKDSQYVFEYASGSHGGGLCRHVVTQQDFEAAKNGDITDYGLILKYDLS